MCTLLTIHVYMDVKKYEETTVGNDTAKVKIVGLRLQITKTNTRPITKNNTVANKKDMGFRLLDFRSPSNPCVPISM